MQVREVSRMPNRLPADDDHPYRTGAWRPNFVEYDADELDVDGALPAELDGIYLRNTENPVMPAIGRYHPFDGDGMVHAIRFARGRASYRNRFVRTRGLAAELEAGAPLWAGIIESPAKSVRSDGWGARGRMKDASSTDIVVHAGRALTTFYQCGDGYQLDPQTLAQRGPAPWVPPAGISAHPKVDPATGELLFFNYGTTAPFMQYGVVDARGELAHLQAIPLPGPRLPHDMVFTERFAVLNDFPLFWDPELLERGAYRPKWRPDLPSRFGVVPRRGGDVRWFEAEPTYVLHFANAFEDGDTIVIDGYHQAEPISPPDPSGGPYANLRRMVDLHAMRAHLHRWRLDLRTGACREEALFHDVTEFPSIHHAKPGRRNRYVWSMTAKVGWFLFDGIVRYDLDTGATQQWRYPDGVYASEAPMAPRAAGGAGAEDDGWLVTFVTDLNRDRSECHVFDAARIGDGPVARVALPERISSGTHACWAPASALA